MSKQWRLLKIFLKLNLNKLQVMKISKIKICFYKTKLDLFILFVSLLVILAIILCYSLTDNKIGIIGQITIIGSVFSLYHFVYKIIQERNYRIYNLRYLILKDLIRTIDEYASLLPKVLPVNKVADLDNLYVSFFNEKNSVISCFKNDFEYAFPDLVECEFRIKLNEFVDSLFRKVTELRNELFKEKPSVKKILIQKDFYTLNKTYMEEFYKTKGEFYLYVRKRL